MASSSSAHARIARLVQHLLPEGVEEGVLGMQFVNGRWEKLPVAPADPILGTTIAWRNDPNPSKMNLGVGAYRTDEGKPYVFKIVKKVEKMIVDDPAMDKEYVPIEGMAEFNKCTAQLIFGADSVALKEKRVATVQTLSGTGSLRVGAEFIAKHMPGSTIYVSNPTWGNHNTIFGERSGLKVVEYPYLLKTAPKLNWPGVMESIGNAPAGSVILLHVCAHNPTGVDPSNAQWEELARLMKQRNLLPFFDCAYQGFASGDLIRDCYSVRLFVSMGFEMFVSQSYAKNFGLYADRIGALNVVCSSPAAADAVLSQLKLVIRPMYSNPPAHGARIVAKVLSNPAFFAEWQAELKDVADRILKMRDLLLGELTKLGTPGDWSHIKSQIGMFSFTGLNPTQSELMIKKHHVYMLKNGRISMAGVTTKNVANLAKAIHDVVTVGK